MGDRGVRRFLARGIRVEEEEGGTEASEARLGTCKRGLGSYKYWRAARPVNVPLMMTEIRL